MSQNDCPCSKESLKRFERMQDAHKALIEAEYTLAGTYLGSFGGPLASAIGGIGGKAAGALVGTFAKEVLVESQKERCRLQGYNPDEA